MKVVCATGHRLSGFSWYNKNGNTLYNENNPECIKIKSLLMQELEKLILTGYDYFISGMALGFDIWFAEAILELKKKYPHIKLIGALPCRNQTERWTDQKQIDRYNYLITQLDDVRCIYDIYEDGCLLERNRFMINNSSLVIALFNGLSGGTKSTIDYAKKQGKEIIIIKP